MKDVLRDDDAISSLAALAQGLPDDLSPEKRVARLWTTPESYRSHVKRRLNYQHIASERELADKTFSVLSNVRTARRSGRDFPVIELENGQWAVILNTGGRIKTAYPIEPDRPLFSDNQRRLGHQVDDINITEGIRAALAGLFGPR